ncbi:response regulator [Oceanispirochaeta sp.]|uniref:response regulator transcription factor n=1 Tax=Oceanispirochaeta sp. TaxID=2035350 RepID=UPI00262B30A7|nr:response regulator [Oceanispirochaeta sp.]MDA3955468.1 response regulator [Oceanispirochaeta sp.]
MIHVLVVEDEPPILKSVCLNIENSHEQFMVVATASNGQEALDILDKEIFRIDVLVTDLYMPVMGGIELLRLVSRKYPDILALVLSGYQDFNYAKEALKTGVFDYLLKPLDKKNLKKQLAAVADFVRVKRSGQIYHQLSDIFHMNGDSKSLARYLDDDQITMILFCAGPYPITENDYLLPGRCFWEKNSLNEYASRYFSGSEHWIIPGMTDAEQILILFSEEKVQESSICELHGTLSQLGSLPVTLCLSPKITDLTTLAESHQKQRQTLKQNIIFSRSTIVHFQQDSSERGRFIENEFENYREMPSDDLSLVAPETLLESMIEAAREFSKDERTQNQWEQHLTYKLSFLSQLLGKDMLPENTELVLKELITNTSDKKELIQGYSGILREILIHKGIGKEKNEDLIDEITEYITLNYNKPLSNQSLSNQFGLVPSRVSKIFKKKKGISPAEFLLKIRMIQARDHLLQDKDLLTREVALMVGYSDPLYFSRVFKNFFGKSPSQIRKEA